MWDEMWLLQAQETVVFKTQIYKLDTGRLRAAMGNDGECLFVSMRGSYTVGIPSWVFVAAAEWQERADNHYLLPKLMGERIDISIITYAFPQTC